jgi:hypothetical protein
MMMADTARKHSTASPRDRSKITRKDEPTREQQKVLDAYFQNPNAAQVGRDLGVSERNVRRIRDRFQEQLEERWRQRDAEEQARADARRRRVEEWVDAGLDRAMHQLDALLESQNESIRLRAAKLRIDWALRAAHGGLTGYAFTALDELVSAHASELQERLGANASADEQEGSAA